MATYVENTLNMVDTAIGNYAESSFAAFAGPIATVCQAMGVVGLAFIAMNALTQWAPIRASEYLKWGIRYVIITAVATSWAQFGPIYDIVTNVPGELGAKLMGNVNAPNLNTAFDQMISTMFEFSDRLGDEASIIFGISMAAIVVWIIGSLMAAAAIIVISLGKIGLGMAIALAPIFIPALMFKATSNLFESWVRFTLGFALIPLVMAGVVGAIVGIGQGLIGDASNATNLEGAGGFLIVGVGAIFMTLMVPTLVNGLSGTITATANGVAMAMGGAGYAGTMAIGTGKGIRAASQAAAPVIGGEIRGHQAGRAAEAAGGNYWEGRHAEMKRQKEHRLKYSDWASKSAAMHGKQASGIDRFKAANAGLRVENRIKDRKD
ncbi:type IV secretion system protein [uncultured Jannaschia sp.]|uniref:type IV secretion system protein n=1 Tax=uncultured Jannaschia sp. TaxID=293347 RepID=UPI00262C0FA3|nr:type IV secretion system protein [uncultured Jannaschia sp.]